MAVKIAIVRWIDIADIQDTVNSQWYTQSEAKRLAAIPDSEAISIGWILENSKEWTIVAATKLPGSGGSETSYSGIHKIPSGCIKQITFLTKVR